MQSSPLDPDDLRSWIVDYVASLLGVDKSGLSTSAPFDSYGLDSVEAVVMAGVMEEEFGLEFGPNILFEDPSIEGIVVALQVAGLVAPKRG